MNATPPSWQAWIFDLDDTLLDTSGELIPEASRKVCEFLVRMKVSPSLPACLALWSHWRSKKSGVELFKALMPDLDEAMKAQIAQQAYSLFRTPELPDELKLLEGGREVLKEASQQMPLFLVTQGDIQTQIKKVEKLKIISFFKHIYYVDPFSGQTKQDPFETILQQNHLAPKNVLSIGNRLNNEIALSKKLGMQTCYLRYGEHSHELPTCQEETPDFAISHLSELLKLLPRKEMAL